MGPDSYKNIKDYMVGTRGDIVKTENGVQVKDTLRIDNVLDVNGAVNAKSTLNVDGVITSKTEVQKA